jgi:beta-phosphoglucomutase-like phosphatase (HAD superfamily)
MLLVLDFDGVFVPFSVFWEALQRYAGEKGLPVSAEAIAAIKDSVQKNQDELQRTLANFGFVDFSRLEEIYQNCVVLEPGAENFIVFCREQNIPFVFYSGAHPERIRATFLKHHIRLEQQDVYFARSKDISSMAVFKKEIDDRFGKIRPLIFVDDSSSALMAGRENNFTTIWMSPEAKAVYLRDDGQNGHCDFQIKSFVELKAIIRTM